MAYQPKSYRKFVATAATATLVASAVAPAALAASSFTDVAPKYKEAVDYLFDNGITKGKTEELFGTHQNITRGELAIWLTRALGLETAGAAPSGFEDTAGTYYDAHVAVLKEEGILDGLSADEFGVNAFVTRGQMAKLLSNAYGLTSEVEAPFEDMGQWAPYINGLYAYEITSGKTEELFGTGEAITRGDLAIFMFRADTLLFDEAPVLSYDGEEAIELAYGAEFTVPEVTAEDDVDAEVEVNHVITDAEGKELEAIDTKVPGTYTITYTAEDSVGNVSELAVTVVVAEAVVPEVESVSANNLKEIQVIFSKEVTKESAEKAVNYVLPGNSVTAELQADKKTVILTVANTLSNNASYDLTVKNVADADGEVIEDTKKSFTAVDTSVPTVVSAVATSYRTVEVTLSEPVQTAVAADFKIDDANPASVTFTANTNKVTLNVTNPLAVGEHTVAVNVRGTIVDLAGYVLPTTSHKFGVVVDTTAPVAESVTINSRTEAVVKFNKPVSEASVNAVASQFKFGTTNDYNAATSKVSNGVTKVDAQTYKVSFTSNPLPVGQGYLFVPAGITDLNGNTVAAKSFAATVVADALPALESVTSPAANVIEVKFNKDVKAASATTKANYVLKNSQGTTVSLAGATLAYDSTNHIVTITGISLSDSSYTLTVKGVEDAVGEKVAETTKTFTVRETSAPQTSSVRWLNEQDGTGKDVVIVTFDEKLATSGNYSVLNKAKWTVNGGALPTGATLEVNPKNEREIIIHLDGNATLGDVFAVNNVADANGNIQTSLQSETLGAAQAGLSLANATDVKLKDAKTIEFKLPRQLSASDASDFQVYNVTDSAVVTDGTNNSIAELKYVNTTSGSTVTITLAKDLNLTKQFDVRTKAAVNYTKDSDGLLLATSTDTATAVSAVQSGVQQAYVTSTTTVEVVVDQPLSAIVNSADFRVVVGDKVITPQSASATGNVIELTLASADALAVNATPVVKTVSQDLIQTETANGQKLKASTEGITAANYRAASVKLANGETVNSATAAADDEIVLTFSNAADASSLGFVAGDKQADGSYEVDGTFTGTLTVGAGNDSIAIANVGTLTFVQNANGDAITGTDTISFDAKLSADGKTLTLTIDSLDGGADGAANDAVITNANFDYITLTPAATVADVDGNEVNASFAPTSSTKF